MLDVLRFAEYEGDDMVRKRPTRMTNERPSAVQSMSPSALLVTMSYSDCTNAATVNCMVEAMKPPALRLRGAGAGLLQI